MDILPSKAVQKITVSANLNSTLLLLFLMGNVSINPMSYMLNFVPRNIQWSLRRNVVYILCVTQGTYYKLNIC